MDASNGSMLQGPFSEGFRSLNENSNDAQWLPVIPNRLKLELIKLLEIYYNMVNNELPVFLATFLILKYLINKII